MKISTATAIAALAAGLMVAAPARAADLGGSIKDSPYEGGREVNSNWSMFYVGVGADWLHNRGQIDYSSFHFDGLSADGPEGTLIGGFQRQLGTFVVGAEVRAALSNASLEIESGPYKGDITTDYSYAGYGKLGYVIGHGGSLFSALGGYKCQHVESGGVLAGYDDTLCGLSGGVLFEAKLGDRWMLGADIIYTKLEDVDLGYGAKLDPDQWATGIRLTYGF